MSNKDWYISYGQYIRDTAIVLGRCACCISLSGNHVRAMEGLSLDECILYFVANKDQISEWSEHNAQYGNGLDHVAKARDTILSSKSLRLLSDCGLLTYGGEKLCLKI